MNSEKTKKMKQKQTAFNMIIFFQLAALLLAGCTPAPPAGGIPRWPRQGR